MKCLLEHMLRASLSPFSNSWSKVYDFTPEDVPNFEICSIVSISLISCSLLHIMFRFIQFGKTQRVCTNLGKGGIENFKIS